MTLVSRSVRGTLIAVAVSASFTNIAFAQDPTANHMAHGHCVDWGKLSLSQTQTQQITQLDSDWHTKYQATQPQIVTSQKKLEKLLADSKSDPLEIMATQQNIARMKEQLRNDATTNYLRKRSVLNETQQHQLEAMLQQMVMDRQRTTPMVQADQAGGIGNIVNKIKWAIEPH